MVQTIYTMHNKSRVDSVPFGREYLILAKYVVSENMERFYLKMVDGKLINPDEIDAHELRKNDGAFVAVSAEVYDKYQAAIHGTTRTPFRSIERLI